MNRRVLIVAGCLVVVAAVIVGVLVFTGGEVTGTPVAQDAAATPTPSSAPPLTEDRAKALVADLTSGSEERVRRALALAPDQPLDPGFVDGMAKVPLTLDVSTFHTEANGMARVVGTVDSAKWTVWLVAVDGQWLISATEQA
ncbi:hypothetical protein [Actinokineospora enzanensis]|uniref:hypothetical protein n=1 Tax=Actinokineospora enzanensis TaxID=155975 RepID=UPI00036F5295|nr:hypothetical protein [Actinokineospora enzanensis]